MLNKISIVGVLALLMLFSCKKDDTIWDREVDLTVDTLTSQIGIDYVIQNPNQIDVQIKMLILNGLGSELNYTGQSFVQSTDNSPNYIYDFSNLSIVEEVPVNNYTNVLLFQKSGDWWFEEHRVGMYLRRYLELYGDTRNIATAYFDYGTDTPIRFSNKNGGSYFDNNWEDDIEMFYEEIETVDQYVDQIPFEYFSKRINEVMDSLIINHPTLPNKIITAFVPSYYFYEDDGLFAQIWTKANANNIQINLLGYHFSNVKQIAYETGGFVIENNVDPVENVVLSYYDRDVSHIGVILQNLDRILSKNYVTHICSLSVTDPTGGSPFLSGNIFYARFIYNGIRFSVHIRLP